MTDFLMLAGGLALLLLGGYALVRGASGLAASFGVSPVIIGLTIVAFGTSAPELAVNTMAAARGSGGLSFGNVIGSNLANLGLVLGLAGVVRPLAIEGRIVVREIPMMILATGAVLVLGMDRELRPVPGVFERTDGLMLLLVFTVFLYASIGDVVRQRAGSDPILAQASAEVETGGSRTFNTSLVVLGLIGLYLGGELTVAGATSLALAAGMSEEVVGLTVVAVGTSLPELVTTVIAVQKGQVDIAVGNVVGSNIFNLLFVLGVTATVAPVHVPDGGMLDLGVLTVLSILLLPLAATHGRRLVRWEGAVFLFGWLGYTGYRVIVAL